MGRVTIFCGGPSDEHEVSLMSTKALLSVVPDMSHTFSIFYIFKDKFATFIDRSELFDLETLYKKRRPLLESLTLLKSHTDLALLSCIHGDFAEDGQLQSMLKKVGIKFTGSGVMSSKICMNKLKSGKIVSSKIKEVTIPKTLHMKELKDLKKIVFPIVLKPNANGSSKGVYIVNSLDRLQEIINFTDTTNYLVQEYISGGIEVTCGCLENKKSEFVKLPPIEILPNNANFFDYESKYQDGGAREICPPVSISVSISSQISDLAIKIHQTLGCKLYSRSDFIYKNKILYYLETNTLPGMTKNSLLPKETDKIGIKYRSLVEFIIMNSI